MAALTEFDLELSTARVVAVEPDPRNASALAALLDGHEQFAIQVVTTIGEAVEMIGQHVPDLIMTPVLLPPAEEADLIERLKQMPQARHVPLVHIPAELMEAVAPKPEPAPRRFNIFRRLKRTAPRKDDFAERQAQMLAFIREARDAHPTPLLQVPSSDDWVGVSPDSALVPWQAGGLVPVNNARNGRERRRARRRRRDEMPWLWAVKLPWGSDVHVVDLSSTGMLVETAVQLDAGSTVPLKMIGEQENLVVPAYAVRSDLAWTERGVLYRVGFEFAGELNTFGRHHLSEAAALRPRRLTELLERVVADVEVGAGPEELRTRFTRELLDLLPARSIRFGDAAANDDVADDADSVRFSVTTAPGQTTVLEVVFEPGHAPSGLELRFLEAAAAAAGAVAAFRPELTTRASFSIAS